VSLIRPRPNRAVVWVQHTSPLVHHQHQVVVVMLPYLELELWVGCRCRLAYHCIEHLCMYSSDRVFAIGSGRLVASGNGWL